MTKVIIRELPQVTNRSKRPPSVKERRVRNAAGKVETIRVLDLHHPAFTAGLQYVFAKNVAKIRRENKAKLGVEDYDVR
jgi:hypothetical protein